MAVTFSYDFSLYPAISYVRLLIGDTNPDLPIFGDDEITAASTIQAMQFGASIPVSYLRAAALLLDALAANKSRLSMTKLLDAEVNPIAAAKALREQAQQFREVDDDAVALTIIGRRRCWPWVAGVLT
jgi:hypothetical protein